jgi:molybdopterin-binding protein
MAQVRLFVEDHHLECLVTADLAAELHLKTGNTVGVVLKASQITVLPDLV